MSSIYTRAHITMSYILTEGGLNSILLAVLTYLAWVSGSCSSRVCKPHSIGTCHSVMDPCGPLVDPTNYNGDLL